MLNDVGSVQSQKGGGSPFFLVLVLVLVFVGLHLHMNYICPPALAVHPPKSLIETGAQRGQPQHKE